jgi:hypothetical protein
MAKNLPKNLPNENDTVIRSYAVPDYRSSEEEGSIEGHPAVYDQRVSIGDYFYEIIERGALDGTDFDDVPLLINHDLRGVPLARSRRNNGNSTMQITLDDKGMNIQARMDTRGNADAAKLVSAVSRGDINGMSFMFTIAEAKWTDLDSDMPTRHILKVRKVWEVSAVTMPAYDKTDISARDKSALDNAKTALENAGSQELDNSRELEIMKYKIQILSKG